MATPPKTRRKAADVSAVPAADAAPAKKKASAKAAPAEPAVDAPTQRAMPRRKPTAQALSTEAAPQAKPAARRRTAPQAEIAIESSIESADKPAAQAKPAAKKKAPAKSSAKAAQLALSPSDDKAAEKVAEKPARKAVSQAKNAAAKSAGKPAAKVSKARPAQARMPDEPQTPAALAPDRPAEPAADALRTEPAAQPARPSSRSKTGKAAPKARKSAQPAEAAAAGAEAQAKRRRATAPVLPAAPAIEPDAEEEGPYLLIADPGETLFGRFELQARDSGERVQLILRGSAPGHYSCSCERFLRSQDARCEHSDFLLEQLQQAGEPIQALLQQGPQTAYSEVWLAYGAERRLIWRAGQTAPADVVAASRALLAADGSFSPEQGQVLTRLIELATAVGHELRVDAAVWPQVAAAADTLQRVQRLEAAFPSGPADAALGALLAQPLPAYQWEAALFAVCAGRALLADDLGLGQREAALAAVRLWQQCFGLKQVLLLAPAERHASWQAEAQNLLGGWPEGLTLAVPEAAPSVAATAELLIVDAVQLEPALPTWPDDAPMLLLSDRELLGEPQLLGLIERIDAQRRGALARLLALGEQAGKRQQREALQAVMLSRRRRELESQLPLAKETAIWLEAPVALDAAALGQVRRLSQRWQQLAYLSQGEQLQLTQSLARLRQAANEEPALAGKSAALIELLPKIVPAVADRVLVCAQTDACVLALGSALSALGLSVQTLLQAQAGAERAAAVQGWREDQGQILLATDAACVGLDLAQAGAALVHADLPWNPAERMQRIRRLAAGVRGLPSWQLLQREGLDAGLWAAQAGHETLPSANLDQPAARPFVGTEHLAVFMDVLAQVLADLPEA